MAACAAIVLGIGIGACGGRIDGPSEGFSGAGPSASAGRVPPGSSGAIGGRPPAPPLTPESIASEIAEAYCKTFSSCCVATKLPPIDVARCREIMSAAVTRRLEQSSVSAGPSSADVLPCIDAVKTRTAACGKEDYPWWEVSDVALLGPANVQKACGFIASPSKPILSGSSCDAKNPCAGGLTCAVDLCVEGAHLGEPCPDDLCLDGAACVAGACTRGNLDAGDSCSVDAECRLGLLCFKTKCASARSHPEQYTERHSPYRVGADTCRAFTDL